MQPMPPPDNASFMWAAYGVALVVYALYAVNLVRRRSKVRQALERELRLQGGRGGD